MSMIFFLCILRFMAQIGRKLQLHFFTENEIKAQTENSFRI